MKVKDVEFDHFLRMALLFDRDVKTIRKHINNALQEELDKSLVVAKFASTKKYGRREGYTQEVEISLYNLDVIISVGYRVKSQRGATLALYSTKNLHQKCRFFCIYRKFSVPLHPVWVHMANKNNIVKAESASLMPLENIENLIHVIRGKQVMLDRDLARLYGVETRVLNQAVQRNIERFPGDFMFQLSKDEFENWKSQFAISIPNENMSSQFVTTSKDATNMSSQFVTTSAKRRPLSALPYAFTENGIAMLSGVLRSQQAININIQIMRAFTAMRHFIATNAQVFERLEVMERTQLSLAAHQESTDQKVEEIFRRLDEGSVKPTEGIFYDGQIFDAYTFVNDRIREAKSRIILIDNYVDDSVLKMLDKRNKGVSAKVYTKNISRQLSLDFDKHNAQYAPIEVEQFDRAHDRFLCIDKTVYHIGASLKDLGKKWFAFNRMEQTTDELLSKM